MAVYWDQTNHTFDYEYEYYSLEFDDGNLEFQKVDGPGFSGRSYSLDEAVLSTREDAVEYAGSLAGNYSSSEVRRVGWERIGVWKNDQGNWVVTTDWNVPGIGEIEGSG